MQVRAYFGADLLLVSGLDPASIPRAKSAGRFFTGHSDHARCLSAAPGHHVLSSSRNAAGVITGGTSSASTVRSASPETRQAASLLWAKAMR